MMASGFDCLLKSPFRMIIAGQSGSGKTHLTVEILLNHKELFQRTPSKIFIFYQHSQEAYKRLKEKSTIPVQLIEGLPSDDFRPPKKSVIIFDDALEFDSPIITSWFTRKSHHMDCDCIYLIQNLFSKNKSQRDISLNAEYFVIFRSRRDISQITRFNSQLMGPGQSDFLPGIFKELTQDRAHSYLFVDLQQKTPDAYRFRSSVIPQAGRTLVYQPI